LTDTKISLIETRFDYGECEGEFSLATTVNMADMCFADGRLINFGNSNFFLNLPSPNPAVSKTVVKFGVGFETETVMEIISATGGNSIKLINERLESGEYEIDLPVSTLPNGSYIISYRSGPFVGTQKLIISK